MHIYLQWPEYLAQWFAHEMYALHHSEEECNGYFYDTHVEPLLLEPVETIRGSLERAVLLECLSKPPRDYVPRVPSDATIKIMLPVFKAKDPRTYFYLNEAGQRLLEDVVRKRMRRELWQVLQNIVPGRNGSLLHLAIEAWMTNNGIEMTDTNYEAVKQQYRRQRDVYRKKLRIEN